MGVPVEKPSTDHVEPFTQPAPAVETSPWADAHGADFDALVAADLPCRRCGYNVRGLARTGRCPECDTPVARALRADLLRYSDARWVAVIARGFRTVNIAIVLALIAIIILALQRALIVPWRTAAITLAIGAVAIVGVWLATAPEPAVVERENPLSTRRMLRVLIIAAIVLQAAGDFLLPYWPGGRSSVRLITGGVWVAGIVCAFRHAAALARRIPDPALAAQTRGVMWGTMASYTVFLVIFAMAVAQRPMSAGLTFVFGLSCTVVIACFLFTVWSLSLVSRYGRALAGAAFEARATALGDAHASDR